MQIKLIRQHFNGTVGYKYMPFSYCCNRIEENPRIMFTKAFCDGDEIPGFAIWHSETIKSWEDEWEKDEYDKISFCPFCGEKIGISVIADEDVSEHYKSLEKERDVLWKKYNKTDSKKKAAELRKKVNELDDKINQYYYLAED